MQKGDLVTIGMFVEGKEQHKVVGKIETITDEGKVVVGVRMFFEPSEIEDVILSN